MIHKMNPDSISDSRTVRSASKQLARAAILDAAEACFAEDGLDKARVGTIAQRAGVAVGTIYNHFGGRADLVRAVLQRRHQQLDDRLSRALANEVPFTAAVEILVKEVFEHCGQHAAFFSLILQDDRMVKRPPGHAEGMRTVLRHVRRALDDAAAEGSIEASSVPLRTEIVVGCIRGGIIHALQSDGGPDLWRGTAARITRFVLAGCA